jgi:hypothetical protein
MCGPMIGIAGAAVSAIGTMAQANAQANAAEYNAKVEKINARSRRQEGLQQSERISDKYDDLKGKQNAAYAKAGVDPFFGSALAIFTDTSESEGSDQDTNYVNAESRATAHENKAKQYEYEAKTQRQAGMIGAASGMLSGLKGLGGSGFGSTLKIG